jgi:hypothetical protein
MQDGRCVVVKGHLDQDGQGMKALNEMMCQIPPGDWGVYTVIRNNNLLTDAQAEQEHNTIVAMIQSYKVNQEVLNREAQEAARQKEENDRMITADAQRRVGQIQAIGAQATARYNATQAANDAQHAGYWAQQDSNARNSAGFSNYMRDQTVVRDVQEPAYHATVSNSTAGWLQQSFPDRVEEVPTSQYIKGTDF